MTIPTAKLTDLQDSAPVFIKDCLAWIVRQKILAGEELFPGIFGIDSEKRRLVEILAAGRGVLLTGAYGVAKTDLAKHVLTLLNEYFTRREAWYVERCPVQEDPAALLRFAARTNTLQSSAYEDPCPICKKLIRDAGGDLSQITVRRLEQLTEGTGFARVQGGGDVLPEEIVGTYNLLKLARIGDPFDPRVFEPGKIGQANRGLLFVDEIGKLPETAQHALIQAGQEGIVTPSKSRETFPVDFLLVATTNPRDEEFICGAVRDRLVSVKIPLVGLQDEMRIVRKETVRHTPQVCIPAVFLKLAVEVVRALRPDERLEMGPRTSINAGLIAGSSALLEGRSVVSFCDMKEGIYTAILGKALHEEKSDVERKIDDQFPAIAAYIEKEFHAVDLGLIVRCYYDAYGADCAWQADRIKSLRNSAAAAADHVEVFSADLCSREACGRDRVHEIMAAYLAAYDRGCATIGKSL
jgi:MoxR-like ATPase